MPDRLPYIEKILQSGQLSYGEWGKKFEKTVAEYIGVEYVLTTCNFSTAIQIAFMALGLKAGDEVIASPMSCLNSTMPLSTFGLKVVWADIDPSTGTLSPQSVERCITNRTKLIFHNHYCGYIGYVDEINNVGLKYNIPIIDDCAESFGSKYKGKLSGNLGTDIAVFSFQTVRLPNTIDGGAVIFKDRILYEKALLIRDQGIRRNLFRDVDGEISKDCDIYMQGVAGTMSEINSYIGCEVMSVMNELLEKQRNMAKEWAEMGINCSLLRRDIEPNFWVYAIKADCKIEVIRDYKKRGYCCSSVHFPNNYYSIFGDKIALPGVEEFYNHFLAIPCGWWM